MAMYGTTYQLVTTCMMHFLQFIQHFYYYFFCDNISFLCRTRACEAMLHQLCDGVVSGLGDDRVMNERFVDEWIEQKVAKQQIGGVFDHRKPVRSGKKNPPPPHDLKIVKGSAYGAFSRQFVQFMVEDKRARDLLQWSRTVFSPDEIFWATLHHTYVNSHLNTPGGFSGNLTRIEKPTETGTLIHVTRCDA